MPYTFEETPLWRRTLGSRVDDPYTEQRQSLRFAYLQMRTVTEALASEIAISLPMFTDHSIKHVDALWDTASQLCGEEFPLNPAEAFVLGGSFLLHDLGMALAAYPNGINEIESDPRFADLVLGAKARMKSLASTIEDNELNNLARDEAKGELLRLRHAQQAERLMSAQFKTSGGEVLYLCQDASLRQTFGELIGQIAYSHWWTVDQLRELPRQRGAYADHPGGWELHPLKIACILRLADAAQIDSRRAPIYTHAFRQPTNNSRQHWYFQERLTRPLVVADRFVYTSTRSFSAEEAAAWWLAFETIQMINNELRQVDALCADMGLPRFVVRSVAGADSPTRLAEHIKTGEWTPIDARLRVTDAVQLVSSIGGKDLYGDRPEIALRELIANASDATRARATHDRDSLGPVIIRLKVDRNGAWWLIVEDEGIGMSPHTMVTALTDFGHSHWRSAAMLEDLPGLLASGFEPTGKFGIGFFAVFMAADEVQVSSLSREEAPRSTHVLEFTQGIAGRPLLRQANSSEWRSGPGTTVRVKLKHDPISLDGIFGTDNRRRTYRQLLFDHVESTCALSDVDIYIEGPEDSQPSKVISAGDWKIIPAEDLFARLYLYDDMNPMHRRVLEYYQGLFVDHATTIMDDDGNIIGRAMLCSGDEHVPHTGINRRYSSYGWVYVGGLRSSELLWTIGAFSGKPLTASRMRAFPEATIENIQQWVESQAKVARNSRWSTPSLLWMASDLVHGFGGKDSDLPCADSGKRLLDRSSLIEWLRDRDEILLISDTELITVDQFSKSGELRCLFFSFDGRQVTIPENALVVDKYPRWLFPDEIKKRPRDERFADLAAISQYWDPRNWWYNYGFGAVGVVIETIAAEWRSGVEQLISQIDICSLNEDADDRLKLSTVNGESFPIEAFRLRRPGIDEVS